MENSPLYSANVNNSSISTTQKIALTNLLMCVDKERLIETINEIMMLDFTSKIEKRKTEDLIVLLLFLEDI